MRPVVRAPALALCMLAAFALAACGPHGPAPQNAFDGRIEDWTREILSDSPELATQAGAPADIAAGYASRLDDRSALAMERRRTAAVRRLAELRALDAASLSEEDRLTYDVLSAQFEAAAASAAFSYGSFTALGGARPYVLNQLDSAFLTLPVFLDRRHAVRNLADADAYIARLRLVAPALDAETARARADANAGVIPPVYIIDDTTRLLDGITGKAPMDQIYVAGFKRKLDLLIAAERDQAARERVELRTLALLAQAEQITREQIIPAHQRAAAALRELRGRAGEDPGVSRLPNGAAFYNAALRFETSTALTPDQIQRIGLDRVRDLNSQLDIALRRVSLTDGPVGARLALLGAEPRHAYAADDAGRALLLRETQDRIATLMGRASNWFNATPRGGVEVLPAPDFTQAASPGAFYSPPSMDGTAPGVFFLNLRNLAEITRIDLPTTTFHEVLGHHMQISLLQQRSELPLLRRLIGFSGYAEGWATYAEALADEQDFYNGDPVGRIGYLRWQLWRAARLVADTGLHAKGWSRKQAIDYLAETTGDAPGLIATEVDRYVVWPGQAAGYEIGRREIMRMREDARTTLGLDFDLKGFHDAVLLNGELPLPVLSRVVREWIPHQRSTADRTRRRR